jgi:chromosome segregation ATPase
MSGLHSCLAAITLDWGGIIAALILFLVTHALTYAVASKRAALKVREGLSGQIGELGKSIDSFSQTIRDLQHGVNSQAEKLEATGIQVQRDLQQGAARMAVLSDQIASGKTEIDKCRADHRERHALAADVKAEIEETRRKFGKLFDEVRGIRERLAGMEATVRGRPFDPANMN